ncbi:hypothetical protein COW36_22745 [bacterium (Candidatus Blackallbacteria) CG17_big_fil_post_rev_8_21_14_2_50_48_46]|uniref:Uncharacterized protein n=1 Tax=bacterium (Candidatus Blackallbacteria) CG17_big_fil_post_rev_8_21_14_2_50_48_46 TaxID=2014261 RepID=A0A2M7FY44_9BACT|nr:MAG: hypothetical protein COW64_07515 [bacterium (Candidatus Blackallbacteria) CG18_big_fil_WC_8_21_14_2_50_49_26]PIW14198.1 MAG: hypothetical protein COW36_22745 [bacterium (Candidatus Blackallbacteria) CG17_big_fil_post_rev_8_21_14_2_50_48_46]PIW46739.1 MAG: hypothetical protein COW20_15020 [bacterium (Candidatus Blackallbacteria) CG13_big_fil_rev_8_21_14_2_50_49_14]
MKCLKCGTNSLYRARSNGKCPQCGKRFVFEPKRGDPYTDGFFQAALTQISAKQSLYFHPRHLYFELARRKKAKPLQNPKAAAIGTVVAGLIFGVIMSFPLASFLGNAFFLVALVYLFILFRAAKKVISAAESPEIQFKWLDFSKHLNRWKAVEGETIPYLLQTSDKPSKLIAAPPFKDLLDYSVERLILCDKPEIVDFLVANQFHLEQKCAILSFNGYPRENFEEIRAMLQRSEHLMVYFIHNASLNGCSMVSELKRPEWFPHAKIFDLGLNPVHAEKFKGLWEKSNSPFRTLAGYSEEELAWLKEWKLDLMVIPPSRLLRHLRNQINAHQEKIVDAYAAGDGVSDFGVESGFVLDFDDGGGGDFG